MPCRARRRSRAGARACLGLIAVALALTGRFEAPVRAAVSLSAVAPLGASAGVVVQITGTGFDATAANNTVTLTLPGGASVSLTGETIAVVDAAKGIRRVGVTVPAGLPTGTASVVVTNRITAESAGGRTLQVVSMALPEVTSGPRGAQQLAVRITGSSNVQFAAGRTTVTFGAGITVASVQVSSPTSLVASLNITANAALGPRPVNVVTSTQTLLLPAAFTVTDPNRPPAFTSSPVLNGEVGQLYAYQAAASDPDGDAVTFRLLTGPAGLSVAPAGLVSWTPGAGDTGDRDVTIEASDGRGGTTPQTFRIAVAPPPQVVALEMTPTSTRMSAAGETRPLSVSGRRSDGQTVNLSSPSTGTTYESSNRFVATVSPDGVVAAVANGDTIVTARNAALSATAAIAVEIGVTLQSLQLTPAATTLRTAGATAQLTLRGTFSDGSTRDLTGAPGTTFTSSNTGVATVAADGLVTAATTGQATITGRHDGREAAAGVVVSISGGGGFLRGEVYDDSRGLPLDGATVTLVSDGGGTPVSPVVTVGDERGRFTMPGRAGDAVVRITRPGYTGMERQGVIPVDGAANILDARLTPLDAHTNAIGSALGGTATDSAQRAVLRIGPGGLPVDTSITLTPLGPQGLEGVLPRGWSPIAGVDIEPAGITFGFPLSLTLTHAMGAPPAGLTASLIRYDRSSHQWISLGAVALDAGGATFTGTIDRSGTFAVVLPDAAPLAPPPAIEGQPLAGLDQGPGAADMSAAGDVVPRSAPPGDNVRAVGRFALSAAGPIPSGTVVQVHVSERFDLLDATQVYTLPFTQDLIAYASPRPVTGGAAGAVFPITPSRSFSIQELMLGVVRLDVQTGVNEITGTIVGTAGGTVTNEDGDALTVPAGALAASSVLALRRTTATDIGVALPASFAIIAALQVDAVGIVFGQGVELSTSAAGVTAGEQVLVTRVFTDPFGQRRLRLVALADVVGGRLVSRPAIGAVALEGIRRGGELVFLRALQPTGYLAGTVVRSGGAAVPSALVTTDSLAIADATTTAGEFIVPAAVGPDVTIRAVDPASGDTATAVRRLSAAGEVLSTTLTVAVVGPTVAGISPAAGATNVPLDTPITIDFSEALAPSSVTETTALLRLGSNTVVATRTLSADRRRLVLRPAAPLSALTTYTIVLTGGIHDSTGNPLTGYTPATFTTLDPSKPPTPASGRIVAELPDESGFVLVTGAGGVAAGGTAVVVTNTRSQETSSAQALVDGSFRVRVAAIVGDELLVTFRGTDGHDVSLRITQFAGQDGEASIGVAGGTVSDAEGRVGSVLPRGLSRAGVFHIAGASASGLPSLPGGFTYADAFKIETGEAAFRALTSLTLTESQNRFAPASVLALPFSATGAMTVPSDALTSSAVQFSAVAQDADGTRRSISGATTIVASAPNQQPNEVAHQADFPTVFLTAPREAVASEHLEASAIAPAARVELIAPRPSTVPATDTVLLVQSETFGGAARLVWVDRLAAVDVDGAPRLRTSGRDLPGITSSGTYALLATHDPLVFATGVASGPEALVVGDGLPVAFRTRGPNGRFIVPLRASQAFTLRFFGADGQLRGTAAGQAPAGGTIDLGNPLGPGSGHLTVQAEPDSRSVVDIGTPLVFRFSEAVDAGALGAALVVTDDAGVRVFGRLAVSGDARTATFSPNRRWRFGARYRFGLAATLVAQSGARLASAFAGEFRTFAPSIVGALGGSEVRDVAVLNATAIAATATGFSTVDVRLPQSPALISSISIPEGAGAAAIIDTPLTDRTGTVRNGPFALVGAGSRTSSSSVQTYELANPASPARVGSTQVTSAPGQATPAGVPPFIGIPRAIAAGADGRAFIAIESVGVASVTPAEAIPLDPANVARGAGPRYPPGTAESASDVAVVGARLLTAGIGGLVVLDPTTLARLGGTATSGDAQGVAGLAAFPFDLNGDGELAADETFDLAAVANGLDGTLQIYRVPDTGDPVLLSVVRFTGFETRGVRLDANERMAYVTLGSRGVAMVDLTGPASIQPIDDDHNGTDDRILGILDTPGSAARIALDLPRGLGFVADGAAGLSLARLLPPRTRFVSVKRDPVRAVPGDEQSILENGEVLDTDDAIELSVDASPGPGESLSLVIGESAAARRLFFPGGLTVARLAEGMNALVVTLDRTVPPGQTSSDVTFTVVTDAGLEVAALQARLVPASGGAPVAALYARPARLVIGESERTGQISVGARLSDGRLVNVTAGSSGTQYGSDNTNVATVSADGVVTAVAGGTARIIVTNGTATATVSVIVQHPIGVTSVVPAHRNLTFTSTGEVQLPEMTAEFSDGAVLRADEKLAVSFVSSDPTVVAINADGRLVAVGNGTARVTATVGGISSTFNVFVELRTPASVSAIELQPFAGDLTTNEPPVVRGRILGTGSLEGLAIAARVAGSITATTTIASNYGGTIAGTLPDLPAGAFTVTLSVVDPATGVTRSASADLTLRAAGFDAEPNDVPAAAPPVVVGQTVSGTLNGGDSRDVFRTEIAADGTIDATVTLDAPAPPSGVFLLMLAADGTEIARQRVLSRGAHLSRPANIGPTFVAVDAAGASVSYRLDTSFNQGAITIGTVSPASGGPGTHVTITGTGFSTSAADTMVLFGGVRGDISAAGPNLIQAIVPANAVDGPLVVISGARRATGPDFSAGNAAPAPVTFAPTTRVLRFDPIDGNEMNVSLLTVYFEPSVDAAAAQNVAAAAGATIVGRNPTFNAFEFEFAANRSLRWIADKRLELSSVPGVRRVLHDWADDFTTMHIDQRDGAGAGDAFTNSGIFDAIEKLRSTPPWSTQRSAFHDVRIGILDTGFDPIDPNEFRFNGQPIVTLFKRNDSGIYAQHDPYEPRPGSADDEDHDGHGTAITSVIAAVNNVGFSPISGVLNGIFDPTEQPYPVTVYSEVGGPAGKRAALTAMALRADPFDIINISWKESHAYDDPFDAARAAWRDVALLLAGRTLLVAGAGNAGGSSRRSLPAMLTRELPWVVSVGATADGHHRASFSNHGAFVDIAADGQDVVVAEYRRLAGEAAPALAVRFIDGTSLAAPQVAGVAGILIAVRGTTPPDQLKTLLLHSARDIGTTWDPGSMRHLDALAALHEVLPVTPTQPVYIANQSATEAAPGEIVAVEINPLTGRPPQLGLTTATVAQLTFARNGVTFVGRDPGSLVIAPHGDYLYAVVSSTDQSLGDGLLVVNTKNHTAEDFIAFSGAPFPPAPGSPPPPAAVTVSGDRPGMVVSKDGRLLYAAAGKKLLIINTVERKIVRAFEDLPFEYRSKAADFLPGELETRLTAITTLVNTGIPTSSGQKAGQSIAALALSPEGRRLYVAFETGGGGGYQPGGVIALNVDLYSDSEPDVAGLQSNLSSYMAPLYQGRPVLTMSDAGKVTGGDQPSGLQVSPDGKYLYLINGGLTRFTSIDPSELDPRTYTDLLGGPAFGVAAAQSGSGGLAGVTSAANSFGNSSDAVVNNLRLATTRRAEKGVVFLAAPGFTGVFDVDPASTTRGQQTWLFPSDVSTGWNPPLAFVEAGEAGQGFNEGALINHLIHNEVYAARPFGMAIRPDGKRALTAYFQTGNFGIVDTEIQEKFESVQPRANPKFATLPDDQFQALVAVTPALKLSEGVWPQRGAFRSLGSEQIIPSPDERLLFPWQIEYAQNGRFAVATHRGHLAPDTPFDARIPNFISGPDETDQRNRLIELGFHYSDGDTIAGPDGNTYRAGDAFPVVRGGGAISIIRDDAITATLEAHKEDYLSGTDGTSQRAWFATAPVCASYPVNNALACSQDVVDRYFEYFVPEAKDFSRPGGVAIYPYLNFETPRFGDVVLLNTPITLSWRQPAVHALDVKVEDLTSGDLSSTTVPLDQPQIDQRSATAEFGALFGAAGTVGALTPQTGHRYRLTISALVQDATGADVTLSTTAIELTLATTSATTSSHTLTLSPVVGAVSIATSTLQMRAVFTPAGTGVASTGQDVTNSQQTCYRWTNGSNCGDPVIIEPALAGVKAAIAGHLSAAGPAVAFGDATIDVVGGRVTVKAPGIQLIAARHESTDVQRPSVILAGFSVESMAIEPIDESSLETGTLGARVAATFGRGNNAPIVIAPSDSRFIDDDHQILLDEVVLRYAGGGTIKLNDLMAAIRPLIEDQFDDAIDGSFAPIASTPTWMNARALVKLLEGPDATDLRYTLDLTTSAVSTAFFSNSPFFRARISSNTAGLALVTGRLNLAGFGTAVDSVLVWSLPPLAAVRMDPGSLTIDRATQPAPGPALRAVAEVSPASATVSLPAGYTNVAQALAALTPTNFAGSFARDGFRFSIAGAIGASGQSIDLSNLRFTFDVPNIQTEFFSARWSSANSSIAGLGAQEEFAQHVVHQNQVGTTTIDVRVEIDGLGIANAQAPVEVCDCPVPESAWFVTPALGVPWTHAPPAEDPIAAAHPQEGTR